MITRIKLLFLICTLFSVLSTSYAQTREQGPWWPHPIWGAGDQSGGSNWITSEKVLKALSLVKSGKVYELGHVYERGMPLGGNRSYNMFLASFPTYGPVGPDSVYFNDEYLAAEIGQVGTQFDGPGHVGQQVRMEDGTVTPVFYNGFTADEVKSPYGLLKLGVENVKPIITRGILLDIAALKGVEILPESYEVSVADVKAALEKQGMTEEEIEPGDALLFNFGWWRQWPKQYAMDGPHPFVSSEVVDWIITKQPSMVGSDAIMDGPVYNVHQKLTLMNGIFNLEWMTFEGLAADEVYKFLFIYTPIRFKGATGSPGRPIGIY